MAASNLNGVGTALVTPFKNGVIDREALITIIRYNLNEGIDFLVPLGTTGETSTLDDYECRQVLDILLETNEDKVPLVCGMFARNNTRSVIDAILSADLHGFHSLLLASPYYNKPSQAGLVAHFNAIADVSPLPIVLYNVPSRTAVTINAESILELAEHPNIISVKEASGDFNIIMQVLKHKPKDFTMLSGDDMLTLPMIACGATGVISVISNAFPGIFSKAVHAALEDKNDQAKLLFDKLLDVHKWLYIEGNPVGIKACLEILCYCSSDVRLPLVPLSTSNKQNLAASIKLLKS